MKLAAPQPLRPLFALCLLGMAALATAAMPAGLTDQSAAGWKPMAFLGKQHDTMIVNGKFLGPEIAGMAIIMGKSAEGPYALAMAADMREASPLRVIKTFGAAPATPPKLSLAKAGSYRQSCRSGTPCAPLTIGNEALKLCDDQANCELIYAINGVWHETPLKK